MALYLGILLFSFLISCIAIVPFIDLLYRLRLTYHGPVSSKVGVPVGGGLLIITLVSLLFITVFTLVRRFGVYIYLGFPLREELNLLFFTFISFGLLGLYDDLTYSFNRSVRYHLRGLLQFILAVLVSCLLYVNLHIHILHLPLLGVLNLGWLYIPMSTVVILVFSHGFDVSDSLDGLSCGTLLIALLAFWSVSVTHLDTPLSVFIALWIGSLIAFLYFNVYPARIRLGSSGSLAFGATLAVTGLLLGKTIALFVIGALFVVEAISPVHFWLQSHGWSEPKIMMRLWLVAAFCAIAGLWLAGL